MKNPIICIPLLVVFLISSLQGAIPQLINYQGLLLDDNGTKVTGIKAITLKVFTGATDGNGTKEIYDENVGNVSITDGLYAFNFGGSGLSVITTTETVGEGNASAQIYNYTVLHPPVLADSASIVKSDENASALATWSQTGGSDVPSFISSVVNSSGAVSVTNASGAPATGEKIKITYDYNSVGIMGALSFQSECLARSQRGWIPPTSPPTTGCRALCQCSRYHSGRKFIRRSGKWKCDCKKRYRWIGR